ncbi:MAG TPA: cytochrome oxidase small assembly protein [Burkholderiales bacterium]|nr:cytochrome oxidase small assembly protein [Burkholderiales bacterium]
MNRKTRTALILLSIALAFFVGIVARFWWMR